MAQPSVAFRPCSEQSAANHFRYRLAITIFILCLIMIGKNSQPDDGVPCIEDSIFAITEPIAQFYRNHRLIEQILFSAVQIFVDLQLIGMTVFWYLKGDTFIYPFSLLILGCVKIIIQMIFQSQEIRNMQNLVIFPSFLFCSCFKEDYFFSGVVSFLSLSYFELKRKKFDRAAKYKKIAILFTIFVLISMRLNYSIDIIVALVFSHLLNKLLQNNEERQNIKNINLQT